MYVANIHSVNKSYVNLDGGICLWIAREGLTLAETKRVSVQGLSVSYLSVQDSDGP